MLSPAEIYVLARETMDALSRHRNRIAEGKGIEPALEFAKFVEWSGLCRVCGDVSMGTITISGEQLRRASLEVQAAALEWCKWANVKAQLPTTELEKINAKLDRLTEALAGKSFPLAIERAA